MKETEPRISVRVSKEMKQALERVAKQTRIDEANLIRACADALIDYIEQHGEITMPLVIKPKGGTYPEIRPAFDAAAESHKPPPPPPAPPPPPKTPKKGPSGSRN